MSQSTYCIRGRQLGPDELETIRGVSEQYWSQGRSAISRALCEHWDWRQANGRLKDRGCRVMLLELAARGEIELPPRKKYNNRGKKPPDAPDIPVTTEALTGSVSQFGSLTIDMVRGSAREKLWDYLVYTHHYLGCPWIVGAYLKYLAYLDGRLVACLGWGSAAWRVACRDAFIGWDQARRKQNLSLVANNVRFLILPWVQVEHLASKVLAANIRRLAADWQAYYCQPLVLLETFVDQARFRGTCYRAANWRYVGATQGTAKRGNHHHRHDQPKAVFLYPLCRDFREQLHG